MNDYMIWLWLLIFIFMIGIEMASAEFVTLWFAIAAIPTMIAAIISPTNIWLQVIIFFSSGFLLMFITRPIVIKYFRKNIVSTNVDSYIGKVAIVTEEITNDKRGYVDFEHKIWSAISSETIEVGSRVRILAIEGNKLIVTKIDN